MILLCLPAFASDPPDAPALLDALRRSLGDPRAVHTVSTVTRFDPNQSTSRDAPMLVARATEDRRSGADGDQVIAVDQADGLAPKKITGGHGPQIARWHAVRVLARHADPDAFAAHLAGDMVRPEI